MGAGVATGPHCPSSMARLPARRPAGRVVHERAGGPFDPRGGSGAAPKRRPFPSGLPDREREPPLLLPDPSGEAAEAACASRGFPPSPAGRAPHALFGSPSALGPKPFAHPGLPQFRGKPQSLGSRHTAGEPAAGRGGSGAKARSPLSLCRFEKFGVRKSRSLASAALFRNLRGRPKPPFESRSAAPSGSRSFFPALPPFFRSGGDSPFLPKGFCQSARSGERPSCPNGPLEVVPASACAAARPASALPPAAALPAAPSSRGMNLPGFQRPVALVASASFPRLHPSGYRNDAVSKTESRKAQSCCG
jgi:hypothetical protein